MIYENPPTRWLIWIGLILLSSAMFIAVGAGSVAAQDQMNCQNEFLSQTGQATCILEPDPSELHEPSEPVGEMTVPEHYDMMQAYESCSSHANAASKANYADRIAPGTQANALGNFQSCMFDNRVTYP